MPLASYPLTCVSDNSQHWLANPFRCFPSYLPLSVGRNAMAMLSPHAEGQARGPVQGGIRFAALWRRRWHSQQRKSAQVADDVDEPQTAEENGSAAMFSW